MQNSFFTDTLDEQLIKQRLVELDTGRVGFYSVGLYPASLAYNCAMQTDGSRLLLAPRPGRKLLGAFSDRALSGMDSQHVETIRGMASHLEGSHKVSNTLSDLILRCELVVLSSNSNHIEEDLTEACSLRRKLKRNNVVIACLAGSFCHDDENDQSYILCEKQPNLAFFSGFHRHGSLRNPLDSFTANFCHPNSLVAIIGAGILDKLSPNIQVSAGVHNLEGQYIKAAKNMSSIFAGFGCSYHIDNPGVLPTLLTLLLNQCLDQAANVSMVRKDRNNLYDNQPLPLTELGYGVQRIEAALLRDGEMEMVRDHTFAQLTAMVADVRGSMMKPVSGKPTRNFQAGQVLADYMKRNKKCPSSMEAFLDMCNSSGLRSGGLEGLKSLKYWPQIIRNYRIPLHDSSMVSLLYLAICGSRNEKKVAYSVMTKSRELTNYCQESVRPSHSRTYADALNNLDSPNALALLVDAVKRNTLTMLDNPHVFSTKVSLTSDNSDYLNAMSIIENNFGVKRSTL